jgi:hypothetical protein
VSFYCFSFYTGCSYFTTVFGKKQFPVAIAAFEAYIAAFRRFFSATAAKIKEISGGLL